MKKHMICILLTGALSAGMLPVTVMAENTEDISVSLQEVQETESERIAESEFLQKEENSAPVILSEEAPKEVYTNFTDSKAEKGTGTSESPYNYFSDALEAVADGGTIILGENGGYIQALEGENGSDMMPFVIDKEVTIKGTNGSALTVRPAGLILGEDVTFEDVKIGLANREKNAVFANGHTLTLNNVAREDGTREIHLFAGGLDGSAAKAGEHGKIVINGTGSKLGNVYAGGMNKESALPATITIEDTSSTSVGTVYACGAETGLYDSNDLFSGEEPEAPAASTSEYSVSGAVKIELDDGKVTTIDGATGGAKNADVAFSTTYRNEYLQLKDIAALTVVSGELAPAALNGGIDVSINSKGILDLSAVMENNAFMVGNFTGGGALHLNQEDVLTINGEVSGTTVFRTNEDMPMGAGTSGKVIAGHGYIIAPNSSDDVFTFTPHSTQSNMKLQLQDTVWTAAEVDGMTVQLKDFEIPEAETQKEAEESAITTEDAVVVSVACSLDIPEDDDTTYAELGDFQLTYAVDFNGATYHAVTEKVEYDTDVYGYEGKLEALNFRFEPNGDPWNTPAIWIYRLDEEKEIEAGTYTIRITAPTASGDVTETVTLTVTKKEVPKADAEISFTEAYKPGKKYDGTAVANPTEEQLSLTNAVYEDLTFTWYEGTAPNGKELTEAPKDAGSYYVVASFAGTDTVNAASATSGVIEITKADAITFNGKMDVTNAKETEYTYDLSAFVPENGEWGDTVSYTLGSVSLGEYYDASKKAAKISGSALTLPIQSVESSAEKEIGTVTVTISSQNYEDSTVTIAVNSTNKKTVELEVPSLNKTYDGKEIVVSADQITAKADDTAVSVADYVFVWKDAKGEVISAPKNAGKYTLSVSVADETYAGSKEVAVEIAPKEVTAAPKAVNVKQNAAVPALEMVYSGWISGETVTVSPAAELKLFKADGTEVTPAEAVKTAGTYTIRWTNMADAAADSENYTLKATETAAFTVTADSGNTGGNNGSSGGSGGNSGSGGSANSGSGSSGSSNSGSSKPSAPSAPSSSVTTGEQTAESGTKTETTPEAVVNNNTAASVVTEAVGKELAEQAAENGSQTVVIAPVVQENVDKMTVSVSAAVVGEIGTKTDASLTISTPVAEVDIPKSGLQQLANAGNVVNVMAEKNGSQITVDITADAKKVDTIAGGVTVTVPVEDVTPGTVAVIVQEDGTREIVQNTVADSETGMVKVALQGSATVEIIDNSKDFADVSESAWFKPAVDFVSARGILSGVGDGAFGYDATMNRAMAMTMLARLGGVDTSGGETWYEKGMTWAAEAGISDGTAPMSDVTREQMAAMLWRYAGEPEANAGFEQFADAQAVSTWAEPAMRWAVEQGILNGDGTNLNASDSMTRAEVAQILMKFMENRMK